MSFTKDEIRKAMLLYAITDSRWLKPGQFLPDVCRDVLENGATFLQLREKDLNPEDFEREADEVKALCTKHGVPYVVNDSVEIAVACGADGVHVGQSDIKGRDIRSIIGEGRILGISAGNVEEAVEAEKAGADYIGVGAVFPTGTKDDAECITMDEFRAIRESVSIPVVAIGGITADNILSLKGCGADGVAVVSAIFAAEDPGKATADLLAKAKEMVGCE